MRLLAMKYVKSGATIGCFSSIGWEHERWFDCVPTIGYGLHVSTGSGGSDIDVMR